MSENISKIKIMSIIYLSTREKIAMTVTGLLYIRKRIMEIAYAITPEKTDWWLVGTYTMDLVVVTLAFYIVVADSVKISSKVNIMKGMLFYFAIKYITCS